MAGGTRIGYDQVNSPDDPPADHVDDGESELAP